MCLMHNIPQQETSFWYTFGFTSSIYGGRFSSPSPTSTSTLPAADRPPVSSTWKVRYSTVDVFVCKRATAVFNCIPRDLVLN